MKFSQIDMICENAQNADRQTVSVLADHKFDHKNIPYFASKTDFDHKLTEF